METKLLPLTLVIGAVAAGCSGRMIDVGTADSSKQAVEPRATPPSRLEALRQRCASAHGSPDVPTKPLEFTALFAKRWFRCGGDGSFWTAGGAGLELVSDGLLTGHYYALSVDDDGNATRLEGLAYQGTYRMFLLTASTILSNDWNENTPITSIELLADPGRNATKVDFETTPSRMRSRPDLDAQPLVDPNQPEIWFIPLDDA